MSADGERLDVRAAVIVVSDRSAAGLRPDETGPRLQAWFGERGAEASVEVVPDDRAEIARAARRAAATCPLVVLAGGTGLGPRDVTPQALRPLLDYEVPGFAETMRAVGRASTHRAILSRSLGGVIGRSLVLAVPGSPRASVESLDAIADVLPHALESLTGADHAATTR